MQLKRFIKNANRVWCIVAHGRLCATRLSVTAASVMAS